MFELYTDEARRSISLAYIAARQFDSTKIETEHLLLGLMSENLAFVNRFLAPEASEDWLRARTAKREDIYTDSGDMTFTDESNRVFSFAAEEASVMCCQLIGIEHLLLGVLREEGNLAARMLRERGANIERIRKELARCPHQPTPNSERKLQVIERLHEILASAGPPRLDLPKN